MNRFYDFKANSLQGAEIDMSKYVGKVVLVVNTASKCGYTPQYKGLHELYEPYHDQGFQILGFPCNQFAGQEPGDSESIQSECLINYGVTFQMFEKIEVNGPGAHPVFQFLKKALPGKLGRSIKWNFTKFLLDAEGRPTKRFGSRIPPTDLEKHIEALLPVKDLSRAA